MREISIHSIEELNSHLSDELAVLVYFFCEQCAVCGVIKPRVLKLLNTKYTKMLFADIDCNEQLEIAGQYGVLTVPTIIIYFDGKESTRFTGTFSIREIDESIERLYSILFDEC